RLAPAALCGFVLFVIVAGRRPGLCLALGATVAAALQAALEQLGEVDNIGAAAGLRFAGHGVHFVDLALAGLLFHQVHDLVLELVAVLVGLPFTGHVFDQALVHFQLGLG